MTRVLGLDLSLTATGYAVNDAVVGVVKVKSRGEQRLVEIRNAVVDLAVYSDVVVLEGYAFARPNQAHQLGELGGVVRAALWERRIPFVEVPPSVLKKYATGKGNADKGAVLAAAIRRLGFEGDDDNAADAWVLRAMGLRWYDTALDVTTLTLFEQQSLERIEWPQLGLAERVS